MAELAAQPLLDLRRHAGAIAGLVALMLAAALTEGAGLVLLVPMLDVLAGNSGGRIAQWISGLGVPLALGPMLVAFVALVLLRAVILLVRNLAAMRLEVAIVDGLRARAWSALLHCEWRLLSSMRQSDNASLLITNVDRVGNGVNQVLQALSTAVTLAGIGLAALAISPLIALGAAGGGLVVMVAYRGMRRRASELGNQIGRAYADVFGQLSEGLGALRVIKGFGREDAAARDAVSAFAQLRQAQIAYLRDMGLGQIALQGGGSVLLAVLVWLAITRWEYGPAQILPLVALFARALPLLGSLQQSWQDWAHARPAIAETADLIARTEAAREPDPLPGTPVPALERAIELVNVGVLFAGRDAAALDRVDLAIPARHVVALSGPSGAGKSTLADLVAGLAPPDSGTVRIDGVALDASLRRAWRTRVTYVQQEPVLFTGTVRDNLLWALPEASEDDMRRALRDASAGFVMALPDGLDTRVGEHGRQLSGGERQRIVLARALLREPALLILDEATSALDAENEAAVAEAVSRLRERMTILIIGHRGRLSDLADIDVRLQDGRIAGIERRTRTACERFA